MSDRLKTAFIVVIMAICVLPLAAMLCGYEGQNLENRPLAVPARLFENGEFNEEFPMDFDAYFEDHFGFREEMVTLVNSMTVAALGDALNDDVVIGSGGMYYYAETLDDYTGTGRLSDAELKCAARVIAMLSEHAEAAGAEFSFAIAPNKNSIYPEYMPFYIVRSTETGNRERLGEYLIQLGVDYIDLYAALVEAKAAAGDALVYHLHDTHWNMRGAVHYYRELMRRLGAPYEDYAAVEPVLTYDYSGDLHYFVSPAAAGAFEDVQYPTGEYEFADRANPARDSVFETRSEANEAALMLYRDSFANVLVPYVSSAVGRVRYSSVFPYDFTGLSDAAFDMVAIELVERNIANLTDRVPLVEARETECALEVAGSVEALAGYRTAQGRVTVYGCFDAKDYDALTDALVVRVRADGFERCYDAFPVFDTQAEALAEGLHCVQPWGFALTLPAALDAGEYSVELLVLRAGAACSSGELLRFTVG
ncbi:MAG: hypothetical protein Q4B99_06445 [Clostridia bacterium]|nr:hypothetical protein [Clostridia bacterium]